MAEVDPGRVRAIGTAASAAGTAIGTAYRGRSAALAPVAGQCPGWSAADALRSGCAAWGGFLDRLAGAVEAFGNELVTAAADYEAADTRAADRLAATR